MSKILLIFITAIFLLSCKKNDRNSQPNPTPTPTLGGKVQLILLATESAPYQFIYIKLPAGIKPIDINSKKVQVIIGGIATDAFMDSKALSLGEYGYYLLVPELSVGDQKISLNIADGKVAEATIKLLAFNKIIDANKYITDYQAISIKDNSDAFARYDSMVKAGTLRKSSSDSLKSFIQSGYDNNKLVVDALTPSEKTIYVQLLDANKDKISAFLQVTRQFPLTTYRTFDQCESYRQSEATYRAAGIEYTANEYEVKARQCEVEKEEARVKAAEVASKNNLSAHEAAKAAADAAAKDGWVGSAKAYLKTYYSRTAESYKETMDGIKEKFTWEYYVKDLDAAVKERTTSVEFEKGKEYTFNAQISLTNLNRQDATLIPEFSTIINSIDNINSVFKDIAQYLPYALDFQVPNQRTKKLVVSGYTIDQVSNSNISINITSGKKGNVIKINSNTTVTGTTNFSFRMNYSTPHGSVSKTIDATLKMPEPALISIVSGNGQVATANSNLPNPLTVLVKDDNGNALQGVNVIWAVTSGGGVVSSTINPTNSGGQSSATWKLGTSGNQSVTATLTKSDGSSVTGSPVTFNASLKIDTLSLLRSKTWVLSSSSIESTDGFTCSGVTYRSVLQSAVLTFGVNTYTSALTGIVRVFTGTTPCSSESNRTISYSGDVNFNLPVLFFVSGGSSTSMRPLWGSSILALDATRLILSSQSYQGNLEFNAQ